MLTLNAVRSVLESESERPAAALKLTHQVFQLLGLEDPATGTRYRNSRNFSVLNGHVLESAKQQFRPEDIHPRVIAQAMFGGDGGMDTWRLMCEQSNGFNGRTHNVLEADGTALVPSEFANVSAFNAITAGLWEAKLLEMWQRPEFIGDQLAETMPSVRRAEKLVGISIPGDFAEERKPGNSHARGSLSERYVTGPTTQNRALAYDVTREAVMFDYTKELLPAAEKIGEAMALRKEYLIVQTVLGVSNTYTYDGTNYSTYLAAADSGNWVNKLAANALTDWTNLNSIEKLLTQMTDQETGQPVNISARQILVMPARYASAEYTMRYTTVARASSGTGAAGLNTALAERGYGPNPFNGRYELLPSSIYVRRIATNATTDPKAKGLGLTDTNADQYWWMGDFKKAFKYAQQLPLTTIRVDANNYQMADQGLVFSIFCDEMGIPMVAEPRAVVMSTN